MPFLYDLEKILETKETLSADEVKAWVESIKSKTNLMPYRRM